MTICEFINKAMNKNLIGKTVRFQHLVFDVQGKIKKLNCSYTNNVLYLELYIDCGPDGNSGYYIFNSENNNKVEIKFIT